MRDLNKRLTAIFAAMLLVVLSPVISFADTGVSLADAVLEASFVSEAVEVSDVIASIEDVIEVVEVKEISEKEEITEKSEMSLLSTSDDGKKAVAVLDGTTLYFYYDSNHEPDEVTSWLATPSSKEWSDVPWRYTWNSVDKVVIDESFSGFIPTSLNSWFDNFEYVKSIEGLCNISTEEVTDMANMFSCCSALTELDLSGFNTENVTTMSDMFSCCSALTELDLSGFNTENVTTMSKMFYCCSSLQVLDLVSFNTANVENIDHLFEECGKLATIYASPVGFNVTKASKDFYVFYKCLKLVGGNGTSYEKAGKNDRDYARIDKEGQPGYFMLKPATVTKEPEALNPVYNGSEQDLVSEGEAEGGIMNYSLDGSNWDEAVPQAKDAGKYTVYYKASGNEHHGDSTQGSLTAEIRHDIKIHEVKEPTCTESGNSLYYECITCGKLYKDADEKTVTTLEEVTVPAKGHDWSGKNGICKRDSSHKCDHNGIKSGVCPVCGKNLGSDGNDDSDYSDYYYSAGSYDAGSGGAVTGMWLYDTPSGIWSFSVAGGTKVTGGWVKAVNPYATGSQPKASWFYFDENGRMLTGWQWIKDKDGVVRCYYLNPVSGGLLGACWLDGRTPDGYMVDKNGAWTVSGKVQTR